VRVTPRGLRLNPNTRHDRSAAVDGAVAREPLATEHSVARPSAAEVLRGRHLPKYRGRPSARLLGMPPGGRAAYRGDSFGWRGWLRTGTL